EQQDIYRTNKSNNTQASISKRIENITLTTEDTNIIDNTISNKKIAQEY
ncbi:1880_t:CDS:2, partial [Scutellospora calospora]